MKSTKNQSGRSMVEMLGVLAIIGTLSIGGIMGYSWAMDKIRLNAFVTETNTRAVTCSSQIIGGATTCNLAEFDSSTNSNGFYFDPTSSYDKDTGMFTIVAHQVTQELCTQLTSAPWPFLQKLENNTGTTIMSEQDCGKTNIILLTFKAELNSVVGGDRLCQHIICGTNQQCVAGQCVCTENACGTGIECYVDTNKTMCRCPNGIDSENGCDNTCDTNAHCAKGYYCHYSLASCSAGSNGVCKITNDRTGTLADKTPVSYSSENNLNYFSQQNFCTAIGMRTATRTSMGCGTNSCPNISKILLYNPSWIWLERIDTCTEYWSSGDNLDSWRIDDNTEDGESFAVCTK